MTANDNNRHEPENDDFGRRTLDGGLGVALLIMLAVALLLASCSLARAQTFTAGCDQNWCWPTYTLTRPTLDVYLPKKELEKVCGRGNYACAIVGSGPVCRRVLPNYQTPESLEKLLAHEGYHCEGANHD